MRFLSGDMGSFDIYKINSKGVFVKIFPQGLSTPLFTYKPSPHPEPLSHIMGEGLGSKNRITSRNEVNKVLHCRLWAGCSRKHFVQAIGATSSCFYNYGPIYDVRYAVRVRA
jgi:hypothetical protein